MTPSFQHRRSASLHSQHAPHPQGLLAKILADCARARREQGRPPLAATLDVATHHEQALVADPTLVRRVLEPLIRRAMESAAEADATCESPVVREVVVTSIDVGSAIEIEVADSGPALPDPVRRWLNETADSFHASSIAPDGAGLALAAIRAAAARIDGTLSAANCPEGGVAITLRLPRRQAQRLAA
jgi:C4-dicarboxylate-specific signal transduction histidine kinase